MYGSYTTPAVTPLYTIHQYAYYTIIINNTYYALSPFFMVTPLYLLPFFFCSYATSAVPGFRSSNFLYSFVSYATPVVTPLYTAVAPLLQ